MLAPEYIPFAIAAFGLLILVSGLILVWLSYRRLQNDNIQLQAVNEEKEKLLQQFRHDNDILQNQKTELASEIIKFKSDLENQKKYLEDKVAYMAQSKEELALKFRDISNEVIKQQNSRFNEEQKIALDLLLKPFQQQITDFKNKVEAAHEATIKNKSSFDEQLKNLFNLNQSLSKDAQDLSAALKGNKKLQGNWGEFQLERVLEVSGLQKGLNYTTQESFKDQDNRLLRPDVIIKMPDNRNIIIDSKVSLQDYVNYVNCEDEILKADFLKKHIQCIKNHIDELSGKEYQKLLKTNSLDYVVIFIPVESAYIEAVKADSYLYDYAYKKNIVITTPSFLLPILRTIGNLWKIENQNKHVFEIAEIGGSLYDKIAGFVEDMQRIDKALDGARKNYDLAMNKLSTGKGNALSLANRLKERGAKASKLLPLEYEETQLPQIGAEAAND